MSRKGHMVCMTSYHAATAYINHSARSSDDLIVVGPDLRLFGEYFSGYTESWVIDRKWRHKDYLRFIESLRPERITYWGYALCEVALLTAHFARRHSIRIDVVLPAPVGDDLYHCRDLDVRVLVRNWRSILKMLLNKMRGWPMQIKTFNNYVYDCIDTRGVAAVKTFRELTASPGYSTERYRLFAEHVGNSYADVLRDLRSKPSVCIVLDEDLDFYEKRTGIRAAESKCAFRNVLDMLRQSGCAVYLKPTYYGVPYLSRFFAFTGIIPGEIPLQALDFLVSKGTVVTGWSATFLQERHVNVTPVVISELMQFLMNGPGMSGLVDAS
jgi:hypothetical protein